MNLPLAEQVQDAQTVRHLRRGVGVIGMALPFALIFGNAAYNRQLVLLGSMSGSYYTQMRNVFVGGLCAIGVFLICYRYDKLDNLLSSLAGVLAIGVALFPTTPDRDATAVTATQAAIGWVHLICAGALFAILACFCLFLFTRTDPSASEPTSKKRVRNRIYYACGTIILVFMALAIASNALPVSTYDTIKPLFWCEAVAVLAFGAAWLVKGETIFKDEMAEVDVSTGVAIPTQSRPTTSPNA